jgi:hypothetical protein
MDILFTDAAAQNCTFLIASIATVCYSTWLVSEAERQNRTKATSRPGTKISA